MIRYVDRKHSGVLQYTVTNLTLMEIVSLDDAVVP
jgi:hypothetical protein